MVLRTVDYNYNSLNAPIQKQGHIPGEIIFENDVPAKLINKRR